ncbi:sulfite exporter TauE/SafE family protein [Wenxinia marina]|uniref:Probable membrane transporter protein n=1 Tax=Wenxinia marina DSM 24838 TaxID=1123501 RepID=A0A0D0NRS4_9RHOB|nr:sulfite exporter TauE/SafE family protein [Wenxinia marina]KIQ70940.1 putative permease [Wenxinia marina DSM 24838]GGL56143.1 UPF0721 transmembrane protein [Wenxinia marina]
MAGLVFDTPAAVAVALIAVILVGLSKGGLGGAMALLGVPIMALVIPPVQAAGILLPILIAMDAVSLWSWRGWWDRRTLVLMLPWAVVGIAVGWATAALVSDGAVRLIVGTIGLLFVARWVWLTLGRKASPHGHRPALAALWASVAGYTSFVAHAGGPPYQVYTMPLRMDPKVYTGTSVVFFAVVNVVKLVPYAALGQLAADNLVTSAALMPVAALATLAGAWLVRRMKAEVFYPFMYAMVTLVAGKLVWDGIAAL